MSARPVIKTSTMAPDMQVKSTVRVGLRRRGCMDLADSSWYFSRGALNTFCKSLLCVLRPVFTFSVVIFAGCAVVVVG